MKDDGSLKVRPIDDMSASGVNSATAATEKLKYDTIDMLFETMSRLRKDTKAQTNLFADWFIALVLLCVVAG